MEEKEVIKRHRTVYLMTFILIMVATIFNTCYWNGKYNELVSCHGFSENCIMLWNPENCKPITKFYGHEDRILFMAVAPDNVRLATASPRNGILRWTMFKSNQSKVESLVMLR